MSNAHTPQQSPPVAPGGLSADPRADWKWFHCIISTYGSWLPGDERGFRTRHHREHVEGDYKNPPPDGLYEERLIRSQRLQKYPEVFIPDALFGTVGEALLEMLRHQGAEVLALSVSRQHAHIQSRMPEGGVPREWIGRAKKHSWFRLREGSWIGKLWAVAGKVQPIKDRDHQINTFEYILRHRDEGAWVWCFHDPVPACRIPQSPAVVTAGLSTVPHSELESSQSPAVATAGLSATSLLQQLVRIPSVNPMGRTNIDSTLLYEDRVVDFIKEILKEKNIPYRRAAIAPQRSNLIATFTPKNATRHLLFEAHTDTVPVDGMSIDPFAATISDGKLFGRGACDVKAGGAAMLAAFLRLQAEKPETAAKVTIAFCVDEEHTFLGVQSLVKEKLDVDFAVVAEPTNLNIVTRHKGVARWTCETSGTACHSSKPGDGVNAVYRMAKVIAAIEAYANTVTISVGVVQGGVSPNTVPDRCRIEVDRRLIPGETAASALEDFQAMIVGQGFDFEVATTLTFHCPPLDAVEDDNTHLLKLIAAIGSPKLEAVPYGTDASSLSESGIPSVVFGPGDIAQAHTHDEWVELAQVERAAEILFAFAASPPVATGGF